MQITFALAALAAVAYAAPQGVTADITPTSSAPAGCSSAYDGKFEITVINATTTTTKRDLSKRAYLILTLAGGQLTDAEGRTGYIASNYQFQFDEPPQNGAIYTGGFSVCSNGSLALGGSNVFYECLSGSFYNLYDRSWADQCEPVLLDVLPLSSTGGATQASDGQPAGTTVLPAVTQITDGQAQAQSAVPVPVSEYTDGQPQVITAYPKPAITQISDGQVQAPTATASGVPVTQISDGQVQATTAAPKATTTTPVAIVTQISDGQIQATGAATTSANATTTSAIPFTGVGNGLSVASSFAAIAVGAITFLLL